VLKQRFRTGRLECGFSLILMQNPHQQEANNALEKSSPSAYAFVASTASLLAATVYCGEWWQKWRYKGMNEMMNAVFFKHSWANGWRAIPFLAVISLLGCAGLEPSSGGSVEDQLPPITASPTHEYHPGKFVWHDLLTADIESAKAFYAALFGWSFEQQGRYAVISNQGRKMGGILDVRNKDKRDAEALWLANMSVADVDGSVDFVKAQGGRIIKGPVDMEHRGRGVLIADPQGAQLLLLHAVSGDPEDVDPAIGDWLWNEIWTNTPEATTGFYQTLGGYDVLSNGKDYQVLERDGRWRAGVRYLIDSQFNVRWVPTVRVDDLTAIVDQVEGLGGVVWVRPDEAPSNGDTALISDSTGALLMVQRWPTGMAVDGEL
jgi:predicted enzyme related to lactoylglutathione lyase